MSDDDAWVIERLRDRDVTSTERAALAVRVMADPVLRAQFVAAVRFDGLLAGVLSGTPAGLLRQIEDAIDGSTPKRLNELADRVELLAAARQRRRPVRPARGWSRGSWSRHRLAVGVAATIAIAFAATLVVLIAPAHGDPEATVVELGSGAAVLEIAGSTRAVRNGESIGPGSTLTARSGTITLVYPDGTRCAFDRDAVISLTSQGRGKRILLERGRLIATVAKQPPDAPLAVQTAHLRVEVVGTRFDIERTAGLTRLEVDEGRVRVAGATGDPFDVAVGGGAIADGTGAFALGPSALDGSGGPASVIAASADENAFLTVPWVLEFDQAIARGAAEHKPLLLWVAWGHPLGPGPGPGNGSAAIGRRVFAADPVLARLVRERCVPVAIDSWWATRRTDDVGTQFLAAVRSVRPHESTYDGFYLITPDGTVLGDCQPEAAGDALRTLVESARPVDAVALPIAVDRDAWHDPRPPAGGLAAITYVRSVIRGGDAWRPIGPVGRDHLWLLADEVRALLSGTDGAGPQPVERRVAEKLARYLAVDSTAGEAPAWNPSAIHGLALESDIIERTPSRIRVRLRGLFDLDDGRRSYRAVLTGELSVDVASSAADAFTIVILGRWRADGADRLLGITVQLAGTSPDDRVPPYGTRDREYMSRP
ncbi:MAG: FecR domain-containing protein [Planctomycetes bacterium]|nr:FecR domain-containing protein [Planctomycetota bacterium]